VSRTIHFTLNGEQVAAEIAPHQNLVEILQQRFDLLQQLAGHHAFAVADGSSGELVVGADRAGEKPLLGVHEHGELVAFASTLSALSALGHSTPLPDREFIGWFFRQGWGPSLLPANVGVLPLARALQCWPRAATPVAVVPATVAATVVGLRESLQRAVARCADVAVPAALSLSGGIDSSCLAAALARAGRPLPAYQFLADGADTAERQLAQAVAAHCGLEFRAVGGGPEVLLQLPALTRNCGLPLGDPSLLAVHALAAAAARDGVRVLLSGEGADELLLGYRRHRMLAALPRLRLPLLPWLVPAFAHGTWARALRAAGSGDAYGELLAVVPAGFGPLVLATWLPPPHWPRPAGSWLAAARQRDIDQYLRHDLLPKLDAATMAAGVEGRCPYLDGEVAAVADGLPLRALLGKRPLRAAFAGELPAPVFRQRKRGFALPLDRWFHGELPWLDLLRERRTLEREHLRSSGVAAAIDLHRRHGADLGHGLYLLVAFELFLRTREEAACG